VIRLALGFLNVSSPLPPQVARWALALSALVCAGCPKAPDDHKAPAKDADFEVTLVTKQEGGQPVPGAEVLAGSKRLGVTDATGAVKLSLAGQEGGRVGLTVKCPAGYSSPSKSVVVGLRRLAAGSPPPRFEAQCTRLSYFVVVGIRAENGARLPIKRLDQVVGTTDDWGAAHVKLEVTPNEQVSLTLDTSGNGLLRPQSPTLTFVASDKDEMVLLEQKFTVQKKYVPRPTKVRPTPL